MGLNTLGLAHDFLRRHVRPGAFCIDATAGRGGDTALLCELAGPSGRVLALDIQPEAVESTRALLRQRSLDSGADVVLDSHANLAAYAAPETADAVVFNLGWLPGGDHNLFTRADSSLAAIEAGLGLLKPGGVMSVCIYYGRNNGFEERDRLLEYLETVDDRRYTVLLCSFHNRTNHPPLAAFIIKEG